MNVELYEENELVKEQNKIGAYSKETSAREKWGKEIEFLFSCIALSVGLGNVWRFPFTALQNGGGAFVIPYIIVLILIGRPVYYLEVVIGQFSSRECIKAFDFAPIMRGVAYGQVYATALATTYYASIMGLTLRYLLASLSTDLPWSYCHESWGNECFDSSAKNNFTDGNSTISVSGKTTSAELYFRKNIMNEIDNIDSGIGIPNWDLVACLAVSWLVIAIILIKGVRSSGKAAYFLAIFPYIVMVVLFIRAVTLPGAIDGIIYFLKPQWDQLLNAKVWYAAITQVFYSLAICFGTLIMYASYNNFSRDIQRDVIIITTVDSLTSILAGCIIFGILGNWALETNTTDIKAVIKGGPSLAFISYPDAIAKFDFLPQVFAILFFVMLFVLGIGSNIGMASCVITAIKDQFTHLKHWIIVTVFSIISFAIGIIYTTPGGLFVMELVDFHGVSFIALILAVAELIAVGWIYGVKKICMDIGFMFDIKTGLYWRICWGIITPAMMAIVLIYTLILYEPLKYNELELSSTAMICAWIISAFGILQLPAWALYSILSQDDDLSLMEKIKAACRPKNSWGPLELSNKERYIKYLKDNNTNSCGSNILEKLKNNLFG